MSDWKTNEPAGFLFWCKGVHILLNFSGTDPVQPFFFEMFLIPNSGEGALNSQQKEFIPMIKEYIIQEISNSDNGP